MTNFRKKYLSPMAEPFVVEEEEQLLEASFQPSEGGDDDYVEARPIIGGGSFDNEEVTSHTSKAATLWDE